jgi:hypothetical protein
VLGQDCSGFCKWRWHRCWRWMCLWYLLSSLNRGELCACKFRFSKPLWAPITLRQKSNTWWCHNTDRALVGIHVVWQCPLLHMSCAKRFEIISGSYFQIRWRNNWQATERNHMHMDMLKSQRRKRKCVSFLWRAQIKPAWDSTTPKCYWSDPLMAKKIGGCLVTGWMDAQWLNSSSKWIWDGALTTFELWDSLIHLYISAIITCRLWTNLDHYLMLWVFLILAIYSVMDPQDLPCTIQGHFFPSSWIAHLETKSCRSIMQAHKFYPILDKGIAFSFCWLCPWGRDFSSM